MPKVYVGGNSGFGVLIPYVTQCNEPIPDNDHEQTNKFALVGGSGKLINQNEVDKCQNVDNREVTPPPPPPPPSCSVRF